MSRKIITLSKYDHRKNKGEINNSPSMTIPDEAYTIQDLYERSAGYIKDDIMRDSIDMDMDHDDLDLNQIKDADLTDKQEALRYEMSKDIEIHQKKKKAPDKPLKSVEKEEKPSDAEDEKKE